MIAVLGLGLGLMFALPSLVSVRGVHPASYYTRFAVSMLARYAATNGLQSEPPLAFPPGDIHDLYRWFAAGDHGGVQLEQLPIEWKDPENGVFVDASGRALVYHFPPRQPEAMFDLYGVGANGLDEGGRGDDITAWPHAEYETYRDRFADGKLNVDWIRRNLGHLRRNAQGEIIAAPPRGFEENDADGSAADGTSREEQE